MTGDQASLRGPYPFLRGGDRARSADVDHCLLVETDSVHRIQQCHLAVHHILRDLVHTLLADARSELQ